MADNNSEILALLGESLRAADREREENMRRFVQLTEVVVNSFPRLEDKFGARIDSLTGEIREVKTDVREIKVQAQESNRRLANTFDHAGQLTERTIASDLRLSHLAQARQPTNAELATRLRVLEEQSRKAS